MSVEDRALAQSLAQYEKIIEQGVDVFFRVGVALAAIRDEKLYRINHKTFEAYCRERWGFERAHAYRLIESSKVLENLSPIGDKIQLPKNESHLREIAKVPPERQAEIVTKVAEKASEEGRKPTAKDYKAAADEVVYEDVESDEQVEEKPQLSRDEQASLERKKARSYAEYLQRSIDDLNRIKRNTVRHPELIKWCGLILKGLERW